jgi:hypothetical protein
MDIINSQITCPTINKKLKLISNKSISQSIKMRSNQKLAFSRILALPLNNSLVKRSKQAYLHIQRSNSSTRKR